MHLSLKVFCDRDTGVDKCTQIEGCMRQSRMTVAVLTLFTADMLTCFTCYVRCRQIGGSMRQNGMTVAVFTLLAADTLYLLLRRFTCYESSRTTLPACTCCWHAFLAADTLYLLWEQSHDIAGRYALAALPKREPECMYVLVNLLVA